MFSSFRQHPSHCSGDACSLFELPESCLMEMALFAADAADRPSYTRIPDVEVDEGPLVAFLLGQAVTQPQECQQMPAHSTFCIRCYLFQMFVECRSGCGKLQICWTFSLVLLKMISLSSTLGDLDRLAAVLQVLGRATVHLAIWRPQLLRPKPCFRTVQWPWESG